MKTILSRIKIVKLTTLAVCLFLLTACGGGGGDSSTGGDGGIIGTAKIPTITSLSSLEAKSKSGQRLTTNIASNGKFSLTNTKSEAYLLRTKPAGSARNGINNYYYSIGHSDGQTSITRNIHPFTDLIIRNWFSTKSLDINSEFEKSGAISQMPTVAEINAIESEIEGIVSNLLKDYGIGNGIDLLATPFDINNAGFDNFLNKNEVIINNSQITLIFNQNDGDTQGVSVNKLPLSTVFTASADTPPTTPDKLRALPASSTEIVIVWEASTDDKGVAGYNIYRNGTLVATSPYPVFTDTGLSSNSNYSYEVQAIDSRSQTSSLTSPTAPLSLNTPDTTPPPSATNLSASATGDDIQLSWTQSQINDVSNFILMRGAPGNANTQIAQITSTAFTDFNLPNSSSPYCYRIISVDAAGNVSPSSNEACATVGGSGGSGSANLSFSASSYEVAESATSIQITVNRSGDMGQAVSVNYTVTAGSATSGTDFTASSGTLNWAANDSSAKTFTVQIASDAIVEGDETVKLTLSSPSGASLNTSSATLTIKDSSSVSCIDFVTRTITEDTTLSSSCYNVKNDVFVEGAATLTINPGVMLKFAAGTVLRVRSDGALNAVGTSSSPIIFTGAQQTPGYWDGIVFYNSNNVNNEIKHAVVEYGGGTSSFGANVSLDITTRIKLSNTTLRQSSNYGISISENAILDAFSTNIFTNNENAPVRIYSNLLGKLDTQSSYSGNKQGFDYISVKSFSDVTTDQTWQALNVPYKMGNIDIKSVLTIRPGATLIFTEGANMRVESSGTLIANGTQAEKITFTAEQATPGYWIGIQFIFNGSANQLDHVIVDYAGGTGGNGNGAVSVYSTPGRLKIHNSTIRNSFKYGLDVGDNKDTVLDMANVNFKGNTEGPVIVHPNVSEKLDKNSDYSGNIQDRIVWYDNDDIVDSQTIKNLGVPYHVGSHDIEAFVTIEPGTELSFRSEGNLDIRNGGALTAVGTSSSPITFTGRQAISGYWDGIQFFTGSLANKLDNTIVEYAGRMGAGNTEGLVGVFFTDSRADVTNSILRHSATNGIWLHDDTSGTQTGNTFEDILGDNIFINP